MTHSTLTQCVQDHDFQERVVAAAMKEVYANDDFGNTPYGEQLKLFPMAAVNTFMWPLAIDNEAAYEYAINSSNPEPGKDPGVISDAAISTGVQAHWPGVVVAIPVIQDQTTVAREEPESESS